jgi:hypothetical protein
MNSILSPIYPKSAGLQQKQVGRGCGAKSTKFVAKRSERGALMRESYPLLTYVNHFVFFPWVWFQQSMQFLGGRGELWSFPQGNGHHW